MNISLRNAIPYIKLRRIADLTQLVWNAILKL